MFPAREAHEIALAVRDAREWTIELAEQMDSAPPALPKSPISG